MRFIVQVRVELDGTPASVVEVATVEGDDLSPATVGLSIDDAKSVLAGVQDVVVAEHCAAALRAGICCGDCGRRYARKDQREIVVRSLYGTVRVASPLWQMC